MPNRDHVSGFDSIREYDPDGGKPWFDGSVNRATNTELSTPKVADDEYATCYLNTNYSSYLRCKGLTVTPIAAAQSDPGNHTLNEVRFSVECKLRQHVDDDSIPNPPTIDYRMHMVKSGNLLTDVVKVTTIAQAAAEDRTITFTFSAANLATLGVTITDLFSTDWGCAFSAKSDSNGWNIRVDKIWADVNHDDPTAGAGAAQLVPCILGSS